VRRPAPPARSAGSNVSDHPRDAELDSLLDALAGSGVPFIVVGGAAAVLHGAPITTQDLDIVPRMESDDVHRLRQTLADLDARVRDLRGRQLKPDPDALAGTGQMRLSTRFGPLDVLRALHDGRGYRDLLAHTVEMSDGELRLRVLDLATLIEVKAGTGRARDRLVLPVLLALQRDADET